MNKLTCRRGTGAFCCLKAPAQQNASMSTTLLVCPSNLDGEPNLLVSQNLLAGLLLALVFE